MEKALFTKTTLRLPTELHRWVKQTADDLGLTIETFIVEAIHRELARHSSKRREIEIGDEMNATLAELYLASMPSFAVIKDRKATIHWVNFFFEDTFKLKLREIIARPITAVLPIEGLQKEAIDENIREALKAKKPSYKVEGVGPVTIRAERFRFGTGMLGDVSFDEEQIREQGVDVDRDVLQRLELRRTPDAAGLFVSFLEAAPVAMAVKRPLDGDSLILWANDVFLELTKAKTSKGVFGQTTRKVFGLRPDHAILRNEAWVVRNKRAYMGKEELKKGFPRWSLRFPIFDANGNVALLGVVSPDYQQNPAPERFR